MQLEQSPGPDELLNVPALQFRHVEAPVAVWKVPAAHEEHDVAFPPLE